MTPPDGLRLRQMVEQDLNAVVAIERESDSAPHWSPSDYLALIQSGNNLTFKRNAIVAEIADSVAGFAIVRQVAAEAELESIVVAERYRGLGVGALLLSESARQAKESRASRFYLEVRGSNTAAVRLYRRAGFLETGRRSAYYRDPDEDAVLMSVTL